LKYLRRGVWYIASRLFLICLIGGIAITVFYYAMNVTNMQIILKDGMATRAKVIMGIETNSGTLNRYFQASCLKSDEILTAAINGNSEYRDYNVRGIDHRRNMGFMWTWPWDTTARLTIQESIPRIDGRVKGTRADEVIARDGAKAVYPPDWPDAQYRVSLVKENGQWKIRSLTLLGGEGTGAGNK
jgi:hypothetical protein